MRGGPERKCRRDDRKRRGRDRRDVTGLRLGLGSAALSTALGAFLRFAREHRSPYDPALVAAAALLLAGKAQGAGPRARDVINVTHRYCGATPLCVTTPSFCIATPVSV